MQQPLQLSADQLATLRRGEALRFPTTDPAVPMIVVRSEEFDHRLVLPSDDDVDPRETLGMLKDLYPEDWDDLSVYPHAEDV